MVHSTPLVLFIGPEASLYKKCCDYLSLNGFKCVIADTLQSGRLHLEEDPVDAVIVDCIQSDGDILTWISNQKLLFPNIPVLVTASANELATAVQATIEGADNFLSKPFEYKQLTTIITKLLEIRNLRKQKNIQQRLLKTEVPCFGSSDTIKKVLEYTKLAAENDTVILLQGETGTGKGVFARWIHKNSQRSSNAFIELNCSSLKGDLLKSELFGHAKGAFTSALKEREGLIEVADGGTLFLDEIGDMDLDVQTQLLKTIEEKSFRHIGENKIRKSDFRLICATNRDLLKETGMGTFRRDLYFRICVFPVFIPPIRERKSDIKEMVEYFLTQFGYQYLPVSKELVSQLSMYDWPGNIRELRNMVERALLLAQGSRLDVAHFPGLSATHVSTADIEEHDNLELMMYHHVKKVVAKYNGDKNIAARALGISLSSLYRHLNKNLTDIL
jgi:DNA-binding NtrC family response regulator